MNKTYCIGSLYNRIDMFEKLLSITDNSDVIYILGNFSISSLQQTSQVTYVYFYNLIKQKQQQVNNSKLPTIKLIKGKNEVNDFNIKQLNDFSLSSANKYIVNMNLSKYFDPSISCDTNALMQFMDNLDVVEVIDNLILVSGFYKPNISLEQQRLEISNSDSLINGSAGKITLTYYDFCKQNKFRLWSKKSIEAFNKSNLNYCGYKTIDEYNNDLVKDNKIVICGDWYDPMFKKDLNVCSWSNLYMIDGGLNRSLNNEKKWFYYEKKDERFNVLDISDINKISIVNLN